MGWSLVSGEGPEVSCGQQTHTESRGFTVNKSETIGELALSPAYRSKKRFVIMLIVNQYKV